MCHVACCMVGINMILLSIRGAGSVSSGSWCFKADFWDPKTDVIYCVLCVEAPKMSVPKTIVMKHTLDSGTDNKLINSKPNKQNNILSMLIKEIPSVYFQICKLYIEL